MSRELEWTLMSIEFPIDLAGQTPRLLRKQKKPYDNYCQRIFGTA